MNSIEVSLNLNQGFSPKSLPELQYTTMRFAGGESHIVISLEYLANNGGYNDTRDVDIVHITTRIKTGDDIMLVLLAKDALERMGIKRFTLTIPYLPYARQDRVCNPGESLSIKVFTNLINSVNFEKVTIFDAHSDVGPALLDRCLNFSPTVYVRKAAREIINDEKTALVLVSPDAGANKKTNKIFEHSNEFELLVKCDKKRNTADGTLSGFEVFTDDLHDKPCLIVDDICDGGRTFIGIAEELKKKNAGNLYLYVSHGIFSYGFTELEKHFKKIYSTNSLETIHHPLVNYFFLNI